MDAIEPTIITAKLWRADPGVGGSVAAWSIGSELLVEFGDEWLREEWLPRITAGQAVVGMAISEPAYGSNVAGINNPRTCL